MSDKLAHMVYFQLNEPTPENVQHLVAECQKYLNDHDGLDYFAVGTLTPDLNREVNVMDFQVSLHTIFESREAHDKYQVAERHLQFIESNKATWKSVRVFDTDLK
ncbi:MAG: Dabb family protein [Pirellulaceae bacterium]